ncbi:LysE family transporter [Halodesulfovibrio marinisediminis]|uniref:Cysteine/O-acetylserine efflux protein n=1 Tax=Halodesulfovibrio marinisediminis DSM 17456 TaxID=1121457 RepID=A0A1N6DKC9_9BACT|nr:LysE family transporter [Halodesulfovibrio marinisediminis]SIN71289.1 cysteine/O-acetylserine efflux protein [Halodesulfovibrio marinisediminis DSM 17456]
MAIDLPAFLSFMVITTFTPGPNNISSASMGMQYGYKKSVTYLFGIMSGFFLIMLLCAFLTRSLLVVLPHAEQYLRWIGSAYILWLAYSIAKSNSSLSQNEVPPQAFIKGFALQLVNPKVAVYGVTIFSTFLVSIVGRMDYLIFFAMILALNCFAAISTWALFGATIRNKLKHDSFRKGVNYTLAALLVYTAISLSGFWA